MSSNDKTVFVNFEKETPEGYTLEPDCIPNGYKNDRSNEGDKLSQLYMELGKAYYEGGFEDPLPQLLPLFDKITKLKNTPKVNENICPRCGNMVEKNARFCGKCGFRML
ncbi:MAG: zinc ribbon domain-containing protein [Schaedlerella sp.]|nr:zinc ribbon domain-containing protein [Schaedlerella sp.]